MHRPKDYYWGHYFSDLFSAQKDLVARAQEEVQCLEEQRQDAIAPEASALFPMGERTGVRNALPRRLFRFYPRARRHYGAPGTGGKDIPQRALDCGFTEGAYLCFEEDCDEPVALRELMDKGMYQAPVNERFAPRRV